MNPLDTTMRQVLYSTGQLCDCCLCSSYDIPQIPVHCSPTKYARVSRCSHGDVVMLFCPSFTQSERFLQTDLLIIRLQVVVVTNFTRMLMRIVFVNVFKSDAVIWWAAIFRTPLSMFDKMLRLSLPESFAMSFSRSCNLCQLAPLVSRCDTLASSTNQCHQLGFTRTQTNHVLLLGRRILGNTSTMNIYLITTANPIQPA